MAQKLKFRPRSRRGIGSFIAVIVVALALGGGAWFFAMAAPPIPVLLMPPKGDTPQDWFAQRLKERFPSGATEADLIRELWLEGFLPRTNLRAERRTAGYESQKDAFRKCRLAANVSWTADDKGLLTGIEGDYSDSCQ